MDQRLRRYERLSGRKRIEQLYASGRHFQSGVVRVTWMFSEEEQSFPAVTMFSAPKRRFRKSVTRNRIKRLMREAFRKHKQILYDHLDTQGVKIRLSLQYTGDSGISYADTEGKIILTLQRLKEEIDKLKNRKS